MTDRYERIRAALEMGPTPGPWEPVTDRQYSDLPYLVLGAGTSGAKSAEWMPLYVWVGGRSGWLEQKANTLLIAACDPDTIRELLAERDQLAADLEAAREDVSIARRALLWLTGGDSGMSSKAICCHMLGMKSDGIYPLDPSDLGRCLRLLELFPEWKPRMGEMARYSAQWAALVERWDELAEMMADEVGIGWSKGTGKRAPRTYAAMKDALAAHRKQGDEQ
jgi:hypothetical protein